MLAHGLRVGTFGCQRWVVSLVVIGCVTVNADDFLIAIFNAFLPGQCRAANHRLDQSLFNGTVHAAGLGNGIHDSKNFFFHLIGELFDVP